MANFAPIRAGGWAFGEILTSSQMNQLNTDFPFAMNGRDGGSYAPSDNFAIQTAAGKTLAFNGLTLNSTASGSAAAFVGDASVAGTLSLTSLVASFVVQADTVNANAAHITSTVDVGGAAGIGGILTVAGTANITGLVSASNGVQVSGAFGLSVLGSMTATGSVSASGGFAARPAIGLDTPGTHLYRASVYDCVVASANTGDRVYQLDDTGLGPFESRTMWFVNYSSHALTVKDPTGGSLFSYSITGGFPGAFAAIMFMRIGGTWTFVLGVKV